MRSITLRRRRDELSHRGDAALKAAACRQAGATFKPKAAHAAAWLSAGAILKPEKPLTALAPQVWPVGGYLEPYSACLFFAGYMAAM